MATPIGRSIRAASFQLWFSKMVVRRRRGLGHLALSGGGLHRDATAWHDAERQSHCDNVGAACRTRWLLRRNGGGAQCRSEVGGSCDRGVARLRAEPRTGRSQQALCHKLLQRRRNETGGRPLHRGRTFFRSRHYLPSHGRFRDPGSQHADPCRKRRAQTLVRNRRGETEHGRLGASVRDTKPEQCKARA
jgi:hypothetical protein